jgi:hypothetical protein
MPCYATGSAEGDLRLAMEENAKETAEKITMLTRVACELSEGAAPSKLKKMSKLTQIWVKKHQKIDKKNKTLKKKKNS